MLQRGKDKPKFKKHIMTQPTKITNYLTIDVEEHFQVAAFDDIIKPKDWQNHESRVAKNTTLLLDLLEKHNTKATFFIVGWTAERNPDLVREIDRQGHDIGCHSYLHRKIYDLTPEEFRNDTAKAKDILEQIIGKKIAGYRAPSYSITKKSLWALDILSDLGFEYDSSIFPILHDNYGIPNAPRFKYQHPNLNLTEFPISTAKVLGRNVPIAGGGYFRLFPYWLTKKLLTSINQQEQQPFMFYLHPWEVDPEQPRMKEAGYLSKFRHYNNLTKTQARLNNLLSAFNFGPVSGF
jgi:polysaccharide deacetylase family protein (PEP-CTERM system associated)